MATALLTLPITDLKFPKTKPLSNSFRSFLMPAFSSLALYQFLQGRVLACLHHNAVSPVPRRGCVHSGCSIVVCRMNRMKNHFLYFEPNSFSCSILMGLGRSV